MSRQPGTRSPTRSRVEASSKPPPLQVGIDSRTTKSTWKDAIRRGHRGPTLRLRPATNWRWRIRIVQAVTNLANRPPIFSQKSLVQNWAAVGLKRRWDVAISVANISSRRDFVFKFRQIKISLSETRDRLREGGLWKAAAVCEVNRYFSCGVAASWSSQHEAGVYCSVCLSATAEQMPRTQRACLELRGVLN